MDDQEWNPDYQGRDWEIVDYQEYRLPGIEVGLRGPAFVPKTCEYFTCIGAAQVYGIFVPQPFPALMAAKLGMPALNLAQATAGPGYYANHAGMLEYVNRGKFLVLQVMAARSEPNRHYDQAGYRETVRDRKTGRTVSSLTAWQKLLDERPREIPVLVRESQANWVESYRRLIEQVKVPIILLWISHDRQPDDIIDLDYPTVAELFYKLPSMVDATCSGRIKDLCAAFVTSDSRRNWGHPLTSRFSGKPAEADYGLIHPSFKGVRVTHNEYYPSPEMHEDIAEAVMQALRTLQLA